MAGIQKLIIGLMLLATSLGVVASDNDYPLDSARTPLGLVWTDDDGMTLYTYTRDRPSTSNCVGACAEQWPPLRAESRHRQFPPQNFSVITRSDGNLQWAYRNRPLYRYSGDEQRGEISGHGFNDQWWIAQPRDEEPEPD